MEDENPSEDEYLLPIHGAASTGERTSNRFGFDDNSGRGPHGHAYEDAPVRPHPTRSRWHVMMLRRAERRAMVTYRLLLVLPILMIALLCILAAMTSLDRMSMVNVALGCLDVLFIAISAHGLMFIMYQSLERAPGVPRPRGWRDDEQLKD